MHAPQSGKERDEANIRNGVDTSPARSEEALTGLVADIIFSGILDCCVVFAEGLVPRI